MKNIRRCCVKTHFQGKRKALVGVKLFVGKQNIQYLEGEGETNVQFYKKNAIVRKIIGYAVVDGYTVCAIINKNAIVSFQG